MFPPFLTYRLSAIQLVHFRAFGGKAQDSRHYRLPTYFHGATISCAKAASAFTAAAICRLIAPLTLPSQFEVISRQPDCADPGIRLTVLYRKAETGNRPLAIATPIIIPPTVPI